MVADQFTLLINKRNLDYEKLIKNLHFTYHYESITLDIYGRCGIYLIPHETTLNNQICVIVLNLLKIIFLIVI